MLVEGKSWCQSCDGNGLCSKCLDSGSGIENGECVQCPSATYGVEGKTCVTIQNCETGPVGQSSPDCTKCELGYGISSGLCDPCVDNTWSDGSTKCQDGPDNCAQSNHTQKSCITCNPGFGLYESDNDIKTCSTCLGNYWSSGTIECQNGPDNCIECDHTIEYCILCQAGFGQNYSTGEC